jgi:hypothetical protein
MKKSMKAFDTVGPANDGYEFELLNAERDESGIFFTVVGLDSDLVRKFILDQERRRADAERRKKKLDTQDENARFLATCTLGWRGNLEEYDFPEFSFENAVQLYKDFPAIERQVSKEVTDEGNFIVGLKRI